MKARGITITSVGIKTIPIKGSDLSAIGVALILAFTMGSLLNCAAKAGDSFEGFFGGAKLPSLTRAVLRIFPEDGVTINIVSIAVGLVTLITSSKRAIPKIFMWTVSLTLLAAAACLFGIVAPFMYGLHNVSREFGDSHLRTEGSARWVDEIIWITFAIGSVYWVVRKELKG